ncbi:hypothetical protein LH430_15335, partial [Laribacter hongkongensis]|uniref:hypothetical protein n=1 Tax=Laribacter hongkongensis TaxID=168471 RepID=UPI001EFD9854
MDVLKRAAAMLRQTAEALKECSTIDGDWWSEREAKREFERLIGVAAELERMAQAEPVNQQMLEALKELRDAYQEFMGVPAVKANAAIAAAEESLTVERRAASVSMDKFETVLSALKRLLDSCNGFDFDGRPSLAAMNHAEATIAAAEAAQEQENNQADPVSTPGLYAVLFRDNWDGESDVYHMLAELIDSGKWVDHRSGRELLEYEGDAILKVWPLNDDKATQVPTRDMLMRVAESVRAACFDACNENGGDWAAIHSLDIAEVINDSLAEIIGELGSTDAAGQSQQVEPVAGQCKFSCESKWLPCSVEHHYHVLSCQEEWPGYETRLLYTAPQPSSPPGWKLVPVEPTSKMI